MSEDLIYGPFINRKLAKECGYKWYFDGKRCVHGHVAIRQVANWGCRACQLEKNAANCRQWYQSKGREQVLAQSREWVKRNPGKRKEIANRYAAKFWHTEGYQVWLEKRKTTEGREKRNNYAMRVRRESPHLRIKETLRSRVRTALRARLTVKAKKTQDLLGCDWKMFVSHLEKLFTDGMTLENFAEWELDHIRPCNSFDLTDEDQQKVCFYYANHQPLWKEENMAKGDDWSREDEVTWIVMMREHGFKGELFPVFAVAA